MKYGTEISIRLMTHYGMLQHLPWYGSYKGADSIALYNMINTNTCQTNLIATTTDCTSMEKDLPKSAA